MGGPSTWRRAVVRGEQVLVCPDCQVEGWTDGLDSCAVCGSTKLAKTLGTVVCRACGASSEPPTALGLGHGGPAGDSALADEVASAVERVLGRE